MIKKICAVYAIRHTLSGRRYIGGSAHVKKRWKSHRFDIQRGAHHCEPLQAAFDGSLNGWEEFVFEILEECDPTTIVAREQHWLDSLTPDDFNVSRHAVAGDTLSRHPRRDEVLRKRVKAQCEMYANLSAAERAERFGHSGQLNGMYGRTHTPEVCEAARKRLVGNGFFRGKRHTPEICAQLSKRASLRVGELNTFFGKKHTPEARKKMSDAQIGVKPPNLRAVMVEGTRYESLTDAARHLGVCVATICFRIKSPNFDYAYCQ